MKSFFCKVFRPGFILALVRQIRLVQDDQTGFILPQTVNIRISAGKRNSCVHQLYDQIDQLQILLHLPLCLGHMTRIPLYVHTIPILS